MRDQNPLDVALSYAARGWAVFPCRAREKRPATRNGFKAATTDPGAVRRWWTRRPDCNVAIATGAGSGLVVLDLDPRHKGDATWAALLAEHGEPPPGPVALTGGGGRHRLFAHPGGQVKSRAHALGPGIDLKADGGYIIAPPSLHPDGGLYRWQTPPGDVDLPKLPRWLHDLLREKRGARAIAESSETSALSESSAHSVSDPLVQQAIALTIPTATGQRNRAIFTFARLLKAHPDLADAAAAKLRMYVLAWHNAAEPRTSGEHSFDDTRADFMYAWERIKYPAGSGPVAEALARADQAEPPQCAQGYADTTRRLIAWCRELQGINGSGPFFLAGRVAAELLGIDRDRAAKLLGLLCADGVLERINKGRTGRASEYRYRGDAIAAPTRPLTTT